MARANRPKGFMVLTGVPELDANLNALATRGATAASKAGLRAGLRVLEKAQRSAAPRGRTGAVAASIGSRMVNDRRTVVTAKAGINVGRGKRKGVAVALPTRGTRKLTRRAVRARLAAVAAPHAHLVGLGTRPRYLKSVGRGARLLHRLGLAAGRRLVGRGYRGVMPANHFIRQAFQSARASVVAAIRGGVAKGIAREVNRMGKKTGSPVGVT